MSFSPSSFKSALSSAGGGARPSLYKVAINDAAKIFSLTENETLLVKAASMPASNIAPLAVNYAGRAYKWQGFRTYDIWNVTVINDENFSIRSKMIEWMRFLSGKMDGSRTSTYGNPLNSSNTGSGYWDGNAVVTQLGTGGDDLAFYNIKNLWPTELGEIAVDWSNDAMEEYTIGFAYDHWATGIVTTTTDDDVDDDYDPSMEED